MSNFKTVLLFVAIAGAGACSDSYNPTPSASGVFPAEGFIGRQVRVEVSGEETKWADGATLSFGDGITVSNVSVASESDIFADLDIAGTAALSDRDVTVTSGKETDTLKAAFKTKSPIDFTIQGQAAQGSVALFTVTNHDFDSAFDTTTTGDGFTAPIVFTNIALDGGPGVALQISNVTPYTITGLVLIDTDAPAMTAPMSVVSGPAGGTTVTSNLGAPVAIMARTATAITSGTPAVASIATADDSALYSVTPGAFPSVAQLAISTTDPNGQPNLAILPASGHFADLLAASPSANEVLKSGSLYVIAYDLSGAAGYSYKLTGNTVTLTGTAADTDPGNDLSTGATTVTPPVLIDNASLTSDTDEDWFKLTVPAGKKIHVVTAAGDPLTDTLVDIYGPNNGTTSFAESSDNNYHEDLLSPAVTVAGTYYVKISASTSGFFDPAHNAYLAAIFLQ